MFSEGASSRARLIVKDGCIKVIVIHIICGTRNACTIPPALPDQLEDVVNAKQDIVHEDYCIKELIVGVPKFVKRVQRLIPDLSQVFDTVIERSSRAGLASAW